MQKFQGYVQLGGQVVVTNGASSTTDVQQSFPLSTVTVYDAGTLNPATIYSDNGVTPKANPFTSDANAYFFFYAANGTYDVTFSGTGISSPFTWSAVLLNDSGAVGIQTLNTLTASTQTFATGTSGTDFTISSATSTHTFNLPTASNTIRGLLSSTDWTTFNAKQDTISVTAPLMLTGSTIGFTAPIPINQGGTNGITNTAAFDNLSPLTTKGDLVVFDGSNNVRLPVGTDTYGLVADSAQPDGIKWAPIPSVPVTVANGGTGATTLTGSLVGNGTSAFTAVAASSQLQVYRRKANQTSTTYEFANPPWLLSTDFDFPAQQPGGTLTGGVGASITLTPVPLGVNGSDTGHYVYISAGTGAAEAVLITGGSATSGAASGTLTFTPANNHSGAWTVTSATGGVQEAISYLPFGNNQVIVPAGTTTLNGNVSFGGKTSAIIVLSNGLTLAGSGTLPATGSQTYIIDFRTGGGSSLNYRLPIFAQTQTVTVANTAAETTLVGTGQGSVTLPANFFYAGKSIKLTMLGYHSSTANPNITINLKLGGTTISTTGAHSSGNGSNDVFKIENWITCRTAGATGTIFAQGEYDEIHTSGLVAGMPNTGTDTIDTTGTLAVNITVTWGTADPGNTISATNFIIENVA